MQNDIAEIKLRAERRAGELLKATVRPGNPQLSHHGIIGRLPENITPNQSSRYQRVAALPEPAFEQHIAETRAVDDAELTTSGVLRAEQQHCAGIILQSRTPEWTTPSHVLTVVTSMLGGGIDLDPCADDGHNVPATRHYRSQDDGLTKPWHGRVFMNPPYGSDTPAVRLHVERQAPSAEKPRR